MLRKPPSDAVSQDSIHALYAQLLEMSQAAERLIALFLTVAQVAVVPGEPRPSLDDLLEETRRRTLGQLCKSLVSTIQRLIPEDPPPDSLATVLAELLRARNWLVHRYYLDRQVLMGDPKQHRLVIEELLLLQEHFVASIGLLRPLGDIIKAVAKGGAGSFDRDAFIRQRLFQEYGDIQASIRRLRARPPFGT